MLKLIGLFNIEILIILFLVAFKSFIFEIPFLLRKNRHHKLPRVP